jgi:hypothetical protein
LRESVARYPQWAQDLFYSDPHFAAAQLTTNPQWLNEQIRRHEASVSWDSAQPDLFALPLDEGGARTPEVPCHIN